MDSQPFQSAPRERGERSVSIAVSDDWPMFQSAPRERGESDYGTPLTVTL